MPVTSAQRLQYLHTQTPADDRIGRAVPAGDVEQLGIGGPAFEMPAGPSVPVPASVAHVAAKRWQAPAAVARSLPEDSRQRTTSAEQYDEYRRSFPLNDPRD